MIRASVEAQMAAPRARIGTCRWCGKSPLPGKRTRWCSDACVSQFDMLTSPSRYRSFVYNRAYGRCEKCRWNIKAHVAQVSRWLASLYPHHDGVMIPRLKPFDFGLKLDAWRAGNWVDLTLGVRAERYQRVKAAVAKMGGNLRKSPSYGLWEVDHVIPLIEGGPHSLENLRLLCRRCHVAETKALASRRRKK